MEITHTKEGMRLEYHVLSGDKAQNGLIAAQCNDHTVVVLHCYGEDCLRMYAAGLKTAPSTSEWVLTLGMEECPAIVRKHLPCAFFPYLPA